VTARRPGYRRPVQAEGYLRAYDDDRDGALDLVIHDLRTSGLDEQGPGWVVALWVAQSAQEHVIENGANTWPTCPEHPWHPLWLAPELDPRASWTCTSTGVAHGRLGELPT